MEKIDLSFISAREGGQILKGYVPCKAGIPIGNSGVTVATGVDIGQMSPAEIVALPIPEPLQDKIIPYALLTKHEAVTFLKNKPLTITKKEALLLDSALGNKIFTQLIRFYDRDSVVPFKRIPAEAQTVLGSLAWHRGPAFGKTKQFRGIWNQAIYQNWEGVAYELRNYQTAVKGIKNRRILEAALLDKIRTTALC